MSSSWYVYILRCSDNTLYTGVTTDLARRLEEHNRGSKGAKYTRARRPVTLVFTEGAESRSEALRREYRIKRLTTVKKEALIATAQTSPSP